MLYRPNPRLYSKSGNLERRSNRVCRVQTHCGQYKHNYSIEMMIMGTYRVVGSTDDTSNPAHHDVDLSESVWTCVPTGTHQYMSSRNPQRRSNRLAGVQRTGLQCQLQHRNTGSGHQGPCSLLKTHSFPNFDKAALRADHSCSESQEQYSSFRQRPDSFRMVFTHSSAVTGAAHDGAVGVS